MAAIDPKINVLNVSSGEVKQVNLYDSTDGMSGHKEFTYQSSVCYAAITNDTDSSEYAQHYSGWSYLDRNGVTQHVLTEIESLVNVFFSFSTNNARNCGLFIGANYSNDSVFNSVFYLDNVSHYTGTSLSQYYTNNTTDHSYNISVYNTDYTSASLHLAVNNATNYTNIVSVDSIESDVPLNLYNCFYNCRNIVSVNSGAIDVVNLASTFRNCYNLTTLDGLANWNVGSVTTLAYTFSYCHNLTTLDGLANWNVGSVTTLYSTFHYCYNLTTLDGLVNWNVSKVTTVFNGFYNCTNLTCAVIPETLASSVNCNMVNAFRNCVNIQGDIYFYGNNINIATNCFNGANAYTKNIYAYAGSRTYNSFYTAMGNNTYNSRWNAYLVEM